MLKIWRQLLACLPRNLWHAFGTTDAFQHNLQLATSLTAFEYETFLMKSGIIFKKRDITMFSKAQLDHLQEGLKETLTIHISCSRIEQNGKKLFFIAVNNLLDPVHVDQAISVSIVDVMTPHKTYSLRCIRLNLLYFHASWVCH